MKATIENLKGKKERITLPCPIWNGNKMISAGTNFTAIYIGPKTGRMFAEFYSCWQKPGTPYCIGQYFEELDLDGYLSLCDVAGIDPKIEAIEV